MAISLRLSNNEKSLIKNHASLHNIRISELFRQAVMEKIEDEYERQCYDNAMKLYSEDQTTYTLDEVEKELGL